MWRVCTYIELESSEHKIDLRTDLTTSGSAFPFGTSCQHMFFLQFFSMSEHMYLQQEAKLFAVAIYLEDVSEIS
jgi:hypothetical protein